MDWALNDQWALGLGARFMEDKRGQTHMEGNIQAGTCTHNNPGDNSPLEMCTPTYEWNRASLLVDGITYSGAQDFSESTGLISLTRTLTPGTTLDSGIIYGTISEGYLHGAFNDEIISTNGTAAQNAATRALIPYGAEFVTNYEVGFKGSFMDGRVRLNADIFLMDYTDKQEEIRIPNPAGVLGPDSNFEYTVNAAVATKAFTASGSRAWVCSTPCAPVPSTCRVCQALYRTSSLLMQLDGSVHTTVGVGCPLGVGPPSLRPRMNFVSPTMSNA